MLDLIYSVVWEGFTVRMFHKKCYKVVLVFSRLQRIKDSGGRVAHIHFSETISNAHICRFCFWYASQQIKPLMAFDVELILWTASGLQSGKERILRLMLHFTRWALSCIELSAPGACVGSQLGWSQREERKTLRAVQEIWGERLLGSAEVSLPALASCLTAFAASWVKSGLYETGVWGWLKGTKLDWGACEGRMWQCVCCGTCGLHGRVTDGTGAAWQSMDKVSW